MADVSVPNTLVSGTTITAAAHNQNYGALVTYINARNDGSASWDNVDMVNGTVSGTLTVTGSLSFIPAGTQMIFYQASAPTGWTAVAVNDKFLRVVSSGGTGGTTGGTVAASSSLAHSHTVNSHTHDLGNHTHSTPAHVHQLDYTSLSNLLHVQTDGIFTSNVDGVIMNSSPGSSSGGSTTRSIKSGTQTDGSGTSGTPSSNSSGAATPGTDSQLGIFAYADIIIATKN